MIYNGMDEIEHCVIFVYKIGTVITESEREISFMTVGRDITSSHLPFMNSVLGRFSKTISSC
jgi:hypothetical protein